MPTDYSDWIIDLPLSSADDLFPTYSDGVDVKASVALFNSMLLQLVESEYPGSWINQGRHKFGVCGPADTDTREVFMKIHGMSEKLYEDGEWYVLA